MKPHKAPSPLPSGAQLETFRRATEEQPDHAGGHYRLGTALLQRGRAREAAAELERAVALDPRHTQAWVNLGGLRLMMWDFAGCVEANRAAAEAEPGLVQARFNQGLGHLYCKQPEEMEACFRRVLELEPEHAAAEYHLAVALLAQNRVEESQQYLAQAIARGHQPLPEFIKAIERRTSVKQEGSTSVIELGEDPEGNGHSHP